MILQNEPKYRHTIKILSNQYYTTKYLMSYLLSRCYILWAFLIRQTKQSRSRSIVCVGNQLNSYVFLQYKITYCPNIEWYLYSIHTLFVLHTVHLDKNLISYCLAVHRIKRKLSHEKYEIIWTTCKLGKIPSIIFWCW